MGNIMKESYTDNDNIVKVISEKDFSGQDLTGYVFRSCTFVETTFKDAIMRNCTFLNCSVGEHVSFERADMTGCMIKQCRFNNADFTKAVMTSSKILNSDFSGSSLYAAKFNGSYISGLVLNECNMNLASFENTEITAVDFLPQRKIPYMRGIKLFKKGSLQNNTIFMSGNQHTEFYDYCLYERRKDRFFNSVNKVGLPLRPFAILFLFLFGLFTDFGQSFKRWSFCTFSIIVAYMAVPMIQEERLFSEAALSSLLAFFGFGEIPFGYDFFYVSESIIGYFMLGALISLLTSKLSIN